MSIFRRGPQSHDYNEKSIKCSQRYDVVPTGTLNEPRDKQRTKSHKPANWAVKDMCHGKKHTAYARFETKTLAKTYLRAVSAQILKIIQELR